MLKNVIVLPDGRELSSGAPGSAVMQLRLTQCVNSGQELTLGSACAAMLEAVLFLEEEIQLPAGALLKLYQEDQWNVRHPVGIFQAEEPVRIGPNSLRLTAYDLMVRTDVNLTDWLAGLDGWPYTVQALAQMVCARCGLELVPAALPNGSFPVSAFRAEDVTGRQLLKWIGEVSGRFCRMDALGRLAFGWYTPVAHSVGPSPQPGIDVRYGDGVLQLTDDLLFSGEEDGHVTLDAAHWQVFDDGAGNLRLQGPDRRYYYQGTLELTEHAVEPVGQVRLRQNSQDVGTVYPDVREATNAYVITGNPLLAAHTAQTLLPVAQTLYAQLSQVRYTPCKVCIPADPYLQPGQILTVTDSRGRTGTAYLMTKTQKSGRDTLECTGSRSRGSAGPVNNSTLKALGSKVLELRMDVDGLRAENRDADGRLSFLEMDVEGLRTHTERLDMLEGRQQLLTTQLQQTADSVSIMINQVQTEGAAQVKTRSGYTFSDEGLRIRRSGESVESLLTHEGLQVTRNGSVLLQADQAGVQAVDVTVGNYLILGSHARFEDYPGSRTACYYI